jgi:hypothetical protein
MKNRFTLILKSAAVVLTAIVVLLGCGQPPQEEALIFDSGTWDEKKWQ